MQIHLIKVQHAAHLQYIEFTSGFLGLLFPACTPTKLNSAAVKDKG